MGETGQRMSEMVERVARAQWNLDLKWGSRPGWDDADPEQRSAAMDLARAAIEAMREPTDGMIGEAMIQPHPSVADAGGVIEQGRAAIRIDYQAMIDEALKG